MDANVVVKKLGIKPAMKSLIINMPRELADSLKETIKKFGIKKSLRGKFDVIVFYATGKDQIKKKSGDIFNSLNDNDSILWIAYPKKGSSIKTDLNRDKIWDVFNSYNYRPVSMVSLDENWSSVRFRSNENISTAHKKKAESEEYKSHIDSKNRIVIPPGDLKEAFKKNKDAKKFFESLAFTHKKEYVDWIISAKRKETRNKRVFNTIERLKSNLKNPHSN